MKILVTGSAGFIGFHLSKELLKNGNTVIGIDNFNDYYDVNLKIERNKYLLNYANEIGAKFEIFKENLTNYDSLHQIFKEQNIDKVVHLAAQAGVRYSISNPSKYIQSNIVGFSHILELCKIHKIKHLLYASSSSVYGGNKNVPFKEQDNVDHPISLYAASKKSNELMAHTYSHLFNLPTTGLRFFTVYGPWGRPDMALFLFTEKILKNKEIEVFNYGDMIRDFTYIDDIVESINKLIFKIPKENNKFDFKNQNPSESWAPYKVFNIGNSSPINLMEYINEIELNLERKASKKFLPLQPGDVRTTSANTDLLKDWIGYKPSTTIQFGIKQFIDWYKYFYKIE